MLGHELDPGEGEEEDGANNAPVLSGQQQSNILSLNKPHERDHEHVFGPSLQPFVQKTPIYLCSEIKFRSVLSESFVLH